MSLNEWFTDNWSRSNQILPTAGFRQVMVVQGADKQNQCCFCVAGVCLRAVPVEEITPAR